jgi:hypothetical protein
MWRKTISGRGGDGQMLKDEEGDKGLEPYRVIKRRTSGKRKDGPQVDMMGKGPTLVKNIVAEKDEGV